MEQFWWGLFLMLELWEDTSPCLEEDMKAIFMPVIGPLDAVLVAACAQMYDKGLDMDNFLKCSFKKCATPTKGPIVKRNQSKHTKQEEEENEAEQEEEQSSSNNNEGEEDCKPVQKCKRSRQYNTSVPQVGDRKYKRTVNLLG
jgi:ribosomal protein L12E/L44/L45/RPP1/RPP2